MFTAPPPPGERGGPPGGTEPVNLGRAAFLILIALVVGVVLLQVGSRPANHIASTAAASPARPASATTTSPTTTPTTVARANVHVLVANGTSAPTAAGDLSNQLQAQGWSILPAEDTTTPVSQSGIYYASGQQPAAEQMAGALGLKPTAVQPLSSSVPVSSTTGADVVVVIGPDMPAHPSGTPTT